MVKEKVCGNIDLFFLFASSTSHLKNSPGEKVGKTNQEKGE